MSHPPMSRAGLTTRALLLLLASGSLASPLPAQGPQGLGPTVREQEQARQEFRRRIRSPHASERARGVRLLRDMDLPWRVQELLQVLRREGPGEGGEEVARAATEILGSTRDPASVEALIRGLVRERHTGVRQPVLRALARIPLRPEAYRELPWEQLDASLREGLLGEDPVALLGSLDAVAALRRVGLRELVLPQLHHPAVPVQSAAIRALRDCFGRQDGEGLAELIDLLPRRTGRIRRELREALTRMTGWPCDSDAECWRQHLERWRAGGGRGGEGDGGEPVAPGQETRVTFLGVPLESCRLLLAVDVSSSMLELCAGQSSRWQLARAALSEAIGALEPDQYFTILFFADGVTWWRRELVQATPAHREQALRRLRRQTISTAALTNFHAALTEAFTLAGPATLQQNGPVGVDTIIFFTDGMPTTGAISLETPVLDTEGRPIVQDGRVKTIGVDQCYERLAALVEWINPHRLVTIDTVGIGEEQARLLLRRLAVSSGGAYTDATGALARRAARAAEREDR